MGEVLAGVIDDMRSADRAQHLELGGAVHSGHLGSIVPGELDGDGSDAAPGTIHQYLLSAADAGFAEVIQGLLSPKRDGGGLFIGQVRWPGRQQLFWHTDIFGIRAELEGGRPEDRVTWLEAFYLPAGRFHFPGQLLSQDGNSFGFAEACIEPHREAEEKRKLELAHLAVPGGHAGGMDAHEHFVLARGRFFHLSGLKHTGRTISRPKDCFHDCFSAMLITTLPAACPSPR